MKIIVTSLCVIGASAFTPSLNNAKTSSLQAVNWAPDNDAFAYGLPGTLDPVPDFDPFNLSEGESLATIKKWREAETQHGRVAMLAFVGLLVTEEPIAYHPLFEAYNKDIGPAIRHLDEVRITSPIFFELFALFIGALEVNRALLGWKSPDGEFTKDVGKFQELKDDYYPGDINFDPLGLKPDDAGEFFEMSTKELQHGRVAMLATAGIIAQELTNGKEIFVNLGLTEDKFDPSSVPIAF